MTLLLKYNVQTLHRREKEVWIFKQSKASGKINSSGNPAFVPGLCLLELVAAAGDPSEVNHAAKPANIQMIIAA